MRNFREQSLGLLFSAPLAPLIQSLFAVVLMLSLRLIFCIVTAVNYGCQWLKMRKNHKFCLINLHISKFIANFAAEFTPRPC